MQLVVEDELFGQGRSARGTDLGFFRLGRIDVEHMPEDVIHRHECSRHAASGAQEASPVQTKPASVLVGEVFKAAFNFALLRGLRQWVELAVRYHLHRHRRRKRRVVRGGKFAKLSLTQETYPSFSPFFSAR